MRITSKGQVTIPIEIRTRSGLLPHTEVEFRYERSAVRLVRTKHPRAARRADAALRALRGSATSRMSTDEIMALTRRR